MIENAAATLTRSAERYEAALTKAWEKGVPHETLLALDRKLIDSERRLLVTSGLPRRPWYKHVLYAPGVYSGYDVKTVPGVREAIEGKRWFEAEGEIARVAHVLTAESELIASAAEDLEKASR